MRIMHVIVDNRLHSELHMEDPGQMKRSMMIATTDARVRRAPPHNLFRQATDDRNEGIDKGTSAREVTRMFHASAVPDLAEPRKRTLLVAW